MKKRIATVQFSTGIDVDANLQKCLHWIAETASVKPQLIVMPEFCNRLSWYNNSDEVYEAAVSVDGPFLQQIAQSAKQQQTYIVINCTTKRANRRVTITSFLYGPDGELLVEADKQTLMGHENIHFSRAEQITPVVETAVGKLGIYACRDGVTMETARSLALRGAQTFCHSLNSFATDEASLHVPTRGLENRCFVVSSNKVGPLIPEHLLDDVAQKLGIPAHFLYGVGESQIMAPDGTILAKADRESEMFVWADVDVSLADAKLRPDGTDIFAHRRPALYQAIATEPIPDDHQPSAELLTAVYQPTQNGEAAIAEVSNAIQEAIAKGVELLVLPELFCLPDGMVDDVETAVPICQSAKTSIQQACQGSDLLVCTSLVEQQDGHIYHMGVLLNQDGVLFRQPQLHRTQRHPWADLGDEIRVCELPWGKCGLVVGDDAIYPEVAKVLAIYGADVLAIPFHAQEAWELSHGIVDRSAENRVCVVAATRPQSFGGSVIITQHQDFTIFTQWETRQFDGTINQPIITRAVNEAGLTIAPVHPATARMKLMSQKTDLINGRPWFLVNEIVS